MLKIHYNFAEHFDHTVAIRALYFDKIVISNCSCNDSGAYRRLIVRTAINEDFHKCLTKLHNGWAKKVTSNVTIL